MTDAAWTPLRRADRAMRDPDDIEALLRRGRFGYTATTSGDQPFLHPTTFWYDQKARRIYFHGARQGRTLQNVTRNPRVCFGVAEMGRLLPAESACDFSLEYASVSVFGRVRLVEEEAEKRHGLQGLLGKYFFVEVIWVPVYRPLESKRGSVLEICGTEANLAMAEYVHAYLLHSAEELWRAHKRAARVRGDRDRRTYLAGVMAGFAEKLARQSTEQRSAGLVWVADGDLSDFYRKRHPHIRNVRYGGQRRTEAFSHGREAGKRLVLRKPIAGAAGSRGRLLGPKGPS